MLKEKEEKGEKKKKTPEANRKQTVGLYFHSFLKIPPSHPKVFSKCTNSCILANEKVYSHIIL